MLVRLLLNQSLVARKVVLVSAIQGLFRASARKACEKYLRYPDYWILDSECGLRSNVPRPQLIFRYFWRFVAADTLDWLLGHEWSNLARVSFAPTGIPCRNRNQISVKPRLHFSLASVTIGVARSIYGCSVCHPHERRFNRTILRTQYGVYTQRIHGSSIEHIRSQLHEFWHYSHKLGSRY